MSLREVLPLKCAGIWSDFEGLVDDSVDRKPKYLQVTSSSKGTGLFKKAIYEIYIR